MNNSISVQWQNIWRGNSLSNEQDSPEQVVMTKKGTVWTGWLIPYIIIGDSAFGSGRWKWWLECLIHGTIPDCPLPPLHYLSHPSSGKGAQARKHLQDIIDYLAYRHNSWDAFRLFVDWLMWGIGEGNYPERLSDENHAWLYRHFQVGHLQQSPYDFLGDIVADSKGNSKGWNPHAFFPTPLSVCEFMSKLQFGDGSEKGKFSTVMDPCVGTGRMLLAAGSDSVFLFGQDIDPLMVAITKINLHLYVPWAALPAQKIDEQPYYHIPYETRRIASTRYMEAHDYFKGLMVHLSERGQEVATEKPLSQPAFDPLNPPGEGSSLDEAAASLPAILPSSDTDRSEQLVLF